MTAKQRAFYLFEHYRVLTLIPVMDYAVSKGNDISVANSIWKNCAIAAVDRMIETSQAFSDDPSCISMYCKMDEYLKRVKSEIEKL